MSSTFWCLLAGFRFGYHGYYCFPYFSLGIVVGPGWYFIVLLAVVSLVAKRPAIAERFLLLFPFLCGFDVKIIAS